MDNWNLRTFSNDLSIFLDLICVKHEIPGDFSNLWDLTGKLYKDFKYESGAITFNINGSVSGCYPSNLNRHIIYFENSISLKEVTIENQDFLHNYKFELKMDSYIDASEKPYKTAWHHDKHEEGDEPKYTHPTYHFHFGGRYLKGLETGDLSIMSSPRIPHPPMDIFLGFHFIISNFFSSKDFPIIVKLKESYDYKQIIKRAQERLWSPYFKSFESTNKHQDFTRSKIFPLYID